jgi:Uncharacterized conserved protein
MESSLHSIILYINGFGIFAPLAAFILFMIQAILPVFPYVILAAAGGIIFGFKLGVLLSWLGALTGACIAYWMCRVLGYSRFLQRFYTRMGYDVRQLDSSMAFWTIIVARIIPIIPTPLINAAAALGGVSFPNFVASSAIGKIPSAVLYTGLGLALVKSKNIKTFLLIIGLTLAFFLLVKYQGKKIGPPKVD